MPIVSSRPCRRGALRLLALALSSSLAACGAARGPSPPLSPPTRVAPRDPLATRWRQIERYVAEELRAGAVPGAAVAVVRGDAAWTRGFGATAIDRSEPVTASTRFPIASLTKLFTGVVILQLVERGALRLDDPVARHVPELAAALSPPGAAPVTVRHLVTHTAGLPDLVDGAVDRSGAIVAMDERQLLAAVAAAPRSPAGERHLYSSTGVALAGLVASRAARAPFADLLERQVLAPLGMTATSARGDAELVPRRRGDDGSDRRSIPAGGVARRSLGGHPTPLLAPCHRGASSVGTSHLLCGEVPGALTPAGGMSSTADDMVRFTRFELGVRRAPEVLSPEAVAASQVDDPLPGAAGIGWLVGRSRGEPFVAHAGATAGHAAAIVLLPGQKTGAVVLLDRLGPGAQCLALSIARIAVDGAPPGRRCLGAAPSLSLAERVAIAGLIAAIDRPSAELLAPLLSPRLAAVVSPATLAAGLAELARSAGRCRGHAIAPLPGGAVELSLACERRRLRFVLAFEPGGRGRLDGVQSLD